MNGMPNGKGPEVPGWIALQADPEVVKLLDTMAEQDAAAQQDRKNKSALMRRLIVDEARRRGLISADVPAQLPAGG